MLYGKIKDSNEYGFGIFPERFDSYVEVADDKHMAIIEEANNKGKIVKPDSNGYPVLEDPPPLSKKEIANARITELNYYLKETDWYVIRFIEDNIPIPIDIHNKRHAAREEISNLKVILNNN